VATYSVNWVYQSLGKQQRSGRTITPSSQGLGFQSGRHCRQQEGDVWSFFPFSPHGDSSNGRIRTIDLEMTKQVFFHCATTDRKCIEFYVHESFRIWTRTKDTNGRTWNVLSNSAQRHVNVFWQMWLYFWCSLRRVQTTNHPSVK